jgi:tetratricopeptide (TPR) repeat protein/Zn-dependent protease
VGPGPRLKELGGNTGDRARRAGQACHKAILSTHSLPVSILLALIYPFLPLLVVFLLLQGTVLLLTYKNLMQTKLRQPRYQMEALASLPSYYQKLFQMAIAPMAALGFEQVGAVRLQRMMALDLGTEERLLWFYHPETGTYGEVDLRFPLEGGDAWSLSLVTALSDGQWLLTLNGQMHGVVGAFPRTILQDSYSPDWESQWQMHRDRLNSLPEPLALAPEQFAEQLEQFYGGYFDALVQKRCLKRSDDSFYFRPLAALRTAWQIKRGTAKVAKRRSQRQRLLLQQPELQVELPLEIQALGFHRMRAIERGSRRLKWGKWYLLGSLALFLAIGYALPHSSGLFLNGPGNWVLNLMFVLVFHELGHFGAMKLFGYQDVTMFFLPLMGAAVAGRKVDASLGQKVWMLLAGPLPGLLLGFGLLAFQLKGAEGLAWMLIAINLANLLPILPLDGGKIAHLILFSRFPLLDVVFRCTGVFFLALLGLGNPLLLGLAVAVAIGIPNSYRTAQLDRDLRGYVRTTPGMDPDDVLITAFRQMRSAGYDKLPFAKRDAIAKELLERFHEDKTSLLKRWLLGGLYSLTLLGGVSGTIVAVAPKMSPMFQAMFQPGKGRDRAIQTSLRENLQRTIDQVTQEIQAQPKESGLYTRRAGMYLSLAATLAEESAAAAAADPSEASPWDETRMRAKATRQEVVTPEGRPFLVKALADYGNAIAIAPKSETYRQRAHLHRRLQNHSAEIADHSAILRRLPQDQQSLADRAQAYARRGQLAQARLDLDALIQLDDQRGDYYLQRANLRHQLKDHRGSIADAEAALRLDAQNAAAYELRSYARKALGDHKTALADFQKSQALR